MHAFFPFPDNNKKQMNKNEWIKNILCNFKRIYKNLYQRINANKYIRIKLENNKTHLA